MNTLKRDNDPDAAKVSVTVDKLIVDLTDGRTLLVPLEWFPRLKHATETERQNWRLLGDGYAIEWPDIDEHIGIEGLVARRRSGECERSFEKWLSSRTGSAGKHR